ncbi:hypothetical protein WAK64_19095 [Bacillus spongiae]|uniref:Lipoprotein n=1 Tax=Bacillus spongiae TaxID=2683610 RepID=A0ABU8HIC3_9BACI
MGKYIYLIIGIVFLLSGCIVVYNGYKPKVGPIENGPNYQHIWFLFYIFSLYATAAFIKSFLLFRVEKIVQKINNN